MSNDEKDPNWHANRLLMLAMQAQQTADQIRGNSEENSSIDVPVNFLQAPPFVPAQAPIAAPPPTTVKWTSDKNPIPEESVVTQNFQGTKAPLQVIPQATILFSPPVPAQSKYFNVVPKKVIPSPLPPVSTPEIVIQGISFTDNPKEFSREATVIEVRHVDEARDLEIGIPLSRYNLNFTPGKKDSRDFKFTFQSIEGLPPHFDLRQLAEWGSIYDQGQLGSCVSNSISASLRWIFMRENKGIFNPSRLFIYYNGREIEGYDAAEDSGISIRGGFQSVGRNSVCGEDNWQYIEKNFSIKPPQGCYDAANTHNQFQYLGVAQNENIIKKCISDGYPISFGLILYDSFMSTTVARTGKVPVPDLTKDQRCGGHCVTITGYSDDSKCFTVLNSWSENWGDKGYCYIPYEYILNSQLASDFWSPRSIS